MTYRWAGNLNRIILISGHKKCWILSKTGKLRIKRIQKLCFGKKLCSLASIQFSMKFCLIHLNLSRKIIKSCIFKIICSLQIVETSHLISRVFFSTLMALVTMENDVRILVKCFPNWAMTSLLWIVGDMDQVVDRLFMFHLLMLLLKISVDFKNVLFKSFTHQYMDLNSHQQSSYLEIVLDACKFSICF